jgi:MarR family transcriptional regulator, organic hydroperoxide resistance regulator
MGTTRSKVDQLDSEILDAMGELIAALIERSEKIAQHFGVPAFCLKALHLLESSMAMRDLGKFMHCDPSFVTAIADLLEKRGLARREASTADRRIKNLVLTHEGIGLRAKVEREFMAHMPWRALDEPERKCLLSLIRKMTAAESSTPTSSTPTSTTPTSTIPTSSNPTRTTPPSTGGEGAGEVSETLITAQRAH